MTTEPIKLDPSGNAIRCQICGKMFRSLGHHLVRAHDMTVDEYKDAHGIPRGRSLTGEATRAAFAASISRTIAAGGMDDHYQHNAVRASAANAASVAERRKMRDAGVAIPPSNPPVSRQVIEGIVAAIEGGLKVATAVKCSPVSYSTFHAGLKRHPDLKARMEALHHKARRGMTETCR